MNSFKSNENIHKKEDGSYYVVYELQLQVSVDFLRVVQLLDFYKASICATNLPSCVRCFVTIVIHLLLKTVSFDF